MDAHGRQPIHNHVSAQAARGQLPSKLYQMTSSSLLKPSSSSSSPTRASNPSTALLAYKSRMLGSQLFTVGPTAVVQKSMLMKPKVFEVAPAQNAAPTRARAASIVMSGQCKP